MMKGMCVVAYQQRRPSSKSVWCWGLGPWSVKTNVPILNGHTKATSSCTCALALMMRPLLKLFLLVALLSNKGNLESSCRILFRLLENFIVFLLLDPQEMQPHAVFFGRIRDDNIQKESEKWNTRNHQHYYLFTVVFHQSAVPSRKPQPVLY